MKNHIKLPLLGLVLYSLVSTFFAFGYYFAYKHAQEDPATYYLQCPSQFKSNDERTAAIYFFTHRLASIHPNPDLDTILTARVDFYIGYGCTDELEKYGYDGTSTIDAPLRAKLIQNYISFIKSNKTSWQ